METLLYREAGSRLLEAPLLARVIHTHADGSVNLEYVDPIASRVVRERVPVLVGTPELDEDGRVPNAYAERPS